VDKNFHSSRTQNKNDLYKQFVRVEDHQTLQRKMTCKTINNEFLVNGEGHGKKASPENWKKILSCWSTEDWRWRRVVRIQVAKQKKLPSLFSIQTVNLMILRKRKLNNSKLPTDRSAVTSAVNNVMYTMQIFLNLDLSW